MIALKGSPAAEATSLDELSRYKLGAQTGTTSLTAIRDVIQPTSDPLVFEDTNAAKQALLNGQVDAILADLPTAFYITAVEIPDGTIVGQFQPESGSQEQFGMLFEKGSALVPCVNQALAAAARGRHARRPRAEVALGRRERARAPVSSVGRLVTQRRASSNGRRAAPCPPGEVAGRRRVATVVVLVVLVVLGIGRLPGLAPRARALLQRPTPRRPSPPIAQGFWINVELFLVGEPLILVLALAVALARIARSPWPGAAADPRGRLHRPVPRDPHASCWCSSSPSGCPRCSLQGVPDSSLFLLGLVALVLSYGAYVAEVFRAGIESIHPSQVASADALGLSRPQTHALRRRAAGACAG